jgi:hypothetical protein
MREQRLPQTASGEYSMVVGGFNSIAEAFKSTAIGTNVWISASASNAVAVSAFTSKSCATTEPGSLTLCADNNVTIEGSALVVNGVDVLMTTSNLKDELLNTKAELKGELKGELADLKAKLLNTTSELADLKVKVAALTTSTIDPTVDLADLKAKVAALVRFEK